LSRKILIKKKSKIKLWERGLDKNGIIAFFLMVTRNRKINNRRKLKVKNRPLNRNSKLLQISLIVKIHENKLINI